MTSLLIFSKTQTTASRGHSQTGSGKTYTMSPIYEWAIQDVFDGQGSSAPTLSTESALPSEPEVIVSFCEMYRGQVYDLLSRRKLVRLMEDARGDVQVVGLREVVASSAAAAQDILHCALEDRTTAANAVHADSSRSHAIFRLRLRGGGTICFVDLAGSERACDTQTDSKETRMEGAEINKSLLALKECIRSLNTGAAHKPFRGSKLTHFLRDSFVGAGTHTVMIATMSPGSGDADHTLNTLRYADRLKEIS